MGIAPPPMSSAAEPPGTEPIPPLALSRSPSLPLVPPCAVTHTHARIEPGRGAPFCSHPPWRCLAAPSRRHLPPLVLPQRRRASCHSTSDPHRSGQLQRPLLRPAAPLPQLRPDRLGSPPPRQVHGAASPCSFSSPCRSRTGAAAGDHEAGDRHGSPPEAPVPPPALPGSGESLRLLCSAPSCVPPPSRQGRCDQERCCPSSLPPQEPQAPWPGLGLEILSAAVAAACSVDPAASSSRHHLLPGTPSLFSNASAPPASPRVLFVVAVTRGPCVALFGPSRLTRSTRTVPGPPSIFSVSFAKYHNNASSTSTAVYGNTKYPYARRRQDRFGIHQVPLPLTRISTKTCTTTAVKFDYLRVPLLPSATHEQLLPLPSNPTHSVNAYFKVCFSR
ncbi:extensin-like [Triticum aestivum]|uniref:extensin-like n=1 Tax=Triticum aestivum TaxID=4565 RepID=UPI001D00D2D2|nr:extensin-like [Triticum aestivum]